MTMITQEQKQQFVNLACDLSPENLSHDGELSLSETERRRRNIMASWKALELECGEKVSQDTANGWIVKGFGW